MKPVSPTCKHCGGGHSIAQCPRVLAAFGPVQQRYSDVERRCKLCGTTAVSAGTSGYVYCDDCRKHVKNKRDCKLKLAKSPHSRLSEIAVKIVQSRDYVQGGYLFAWRKALSDGTLEPGMIVEYHGARHRVCGAPGSVQYLSKETKRRCKR